MLFLRILLLRFHKTTTDCDCVEFVSANPTIQDLLAAGLHVEYPFALLFYNRNRKREIVVPDCKDGAVRIFWIRPDVAFLFGLGSKCEGLVFVSNRILRANHIGAGRPENFGQGLFVKWLGCLPKATLCPFPCVLRFRL